MYWELIGLLLALTLVHTRYADEDAFLYWRRAGTPEKPKCTPFTEFMEECNKCICSAEGIEYCTRMYCMNAVKVTRVQEEVSNTDKMETNYDY